MEHHLKRPPGMGEMKRIAEAQALTLRAELRVAMRMRQLTAEDVAHLAKLDQAAVEAFLGGSSINPRWQEKLMKWLERSQADESDEHP